MDIEIDEIPESLSVDTGPPVNLGFLQNLYRPKTVSMRAEVAHTVALQFLNLLQEEFPDEEEYRRLMMNWLRSVKDKDFPKFLKVYRRALRDRENPASGTTSE